MNLAHVGIETWLSGQNRFDITLRQNDSVTISSIYGMVAASPQEKCTWFGRPTKRRDSLTVLEFDQRTDSPPPDMPSIAANVGVGQRNMGVSNNALLMVIIKTIGLEAKHSTVERVFDPPVLVPSGKLRLLVNNTNGGPLRVDDDVLNTEVHLTIQWDKF